METMNYDHNDTKYQAGGTFETTIGTTSYEVEMKFLEEGMSLEEKTLRAVKRRQEKEKKGA